MTTPRLLLPELAANQAQPHLTLNSALRIVDVLLQNSAVAQQDAPPVSPAEGDLYIVGTIPTGVWVGHAQAVAMFLGGTWVYRTPQEGWIVYVRGVGLKIYGTGSPDTWDDLVTGGGGNIIADPNWVAKGNLVVGTGAGAAAILGPPVFDGSYLAGDAAGNVLWNILTPPNPRRYVQGFFSGAPTASQVIWVHQVDSVSVFAPGDFQAQAITPPTDTATIDILIMHGATQLGHLVVDSSGYGYGVDDGSGPYTITAGDNIMFVAPSTPDSTLADIAIVGFETI